MHSAWCPASATTFYPAGGGNPVRVVVIGGTGHIGSYLTPRLVNAGHKVTCLSRGLKEPYHGDQAWHAVERIDLDRAVDEAAGRFGERVASLDPAAVIDLTC